MCLKMETRLKCVLKSADKIEPEFPDKKVAPLQAADLIAWRTATPWTRR
jgi:hypothetical protein